MLVTPVAIVQELDASTGVKLVPISDETVSGLQELNRGYIDYTIPKEVYGGQQDIQSIAAQTTLLVADNLPEDYVSDLTRILIENADQWGNMNVGMKDFDATYATSNLPEGLSLHPGARSYYEEVNALSTRECKRRVDKERGRFAYELASLLRVYSDSRVSDFDSRYATS
jgi:TRAP transporter TAXI family solute receptor